MPSTDVLSLVGLDWQLAKPLATVPCPLCNEQAGYVATDYGIAHRDPDGKPHLCRVTEERLKSRFGPLTDLVGKLRQDYHGSAVIDLKLELSGWYYEYEVLGLDVADGYGDDAMAMNAWVAEAHIRALQEEIAETDRRRVRLKHVDFSPWVERVAAARNIPLRRVAEALGVRGGKQGCHCPLPGHPGGDKNPSASLGTHAFTCFVCGKSLPSISLVMEAKKLSFKESVLWIEENAA